MADARPHTQNLSELGSTIAEQLGDVKRPWNVPEMNDRIIALDNNVGDNVKLIMSDEKAA